MRRLGRAPLMEAWHFLRKDRTLQYEPSTLVEVGQTLTVDPDELRLCNYGLHASVRAIDALQFAPGPVVCRVRLGGKIIEESDKVCASERTVIWMADASNTLHEFACDVAEKALKNHDVTEERSWAAIETKRKWLKGEATDAELAAASAAAWAARGAAWDASAAAWAAAWDASDAASDAARDASDAARDAARDASDAARAAAWGEQNTMLENALEKP